MQLASHVHRDNQCSEVNVQAAYISSSLMAGQEVEYQQGWVVEIFSPKSCLSCASVLRCPLRMHVTASQHLIRWSDAVINPELQSLNPERQTHVLPGSVQDANPKP